MSAGGSLKMRRTRGGVNIRVTGELAQSLTTLLAAQTAALRARTQMVVRFVDEGQDVLTWHLDPRGVVTACAPYHGDIYVGARVIGMPLPGDQVDFVPAAGGKRKTLRWPVEAVELRTEGS